MLGISYYDKLDTYLNNYIKNENKDLENKPSSIFKLTNNQDNQLKNTSSQEKYSLAFLCQKLKEDMLKLEKFIKDNEYREKLQKSLYPYHNPELFDILGLEKKIKEKIGIPENATIRYEKVKCSKHCIHNHQYFYAYYWDPNTKKLKKKYIGKELPEPF
jgi:hypothetical protein